MDEIAGAVREVVGVSRGNHHSNLAVVLRRDKQLVIVRTPVQSCNGKRDVQTMGGGV